MRRGFFLLISAGLLAAPAWAQTGSAGPIREVRSGIGVDANGNQVIDPTKNVEQLVKALEEKTRELREADLKLIQAKLDANEKLAELRSKNLFDADVSNTRRIDELAKLRAELNDKLATAERDRINAIRLVDVSAAADLQRRTSESANNLQTQTAQLATDLRTSTALLADNLRTLVNTTAANNLTAQKQTADEISKRLTTIEQAQSEGRGKQQYQDPEATAVKAQLQVLLQQAAANKGSDKGQSDAIFYVLAALGLGLPIAVAIYLRRPADRSA